jgi:hypothetical protein
MGKHGPGNCFNGAAPIWARRGRRLALSKLLTCGFNGAVLRCRASVAAKVFDWLIF